jgi:hypothetical protein
MPITRPTTKTKISTAEWGWPITDEVNRLTTATAISTPWTNAILQNGWQNYNGVGFAPVAFRKVGDRVEVRGGAMNGAIGATIFTLPVGHRSPFNIQYTAPSWSIVGVVTVDVSGNVYPNAPTDARFVGLNFSFSVTP